LIRRQSIGLALAILFAQLPVIALFVLPLESLYHSIDNQTVVYYKREPESYNWHEMIQQQQQQKRA
jgi:hypothetical protein